MRTELDGRNVLIADRFWYFGGTRRELPERFWKLDSPNPRARIGHWYRPPLTDTELDALIEWLDRYGSGVVGSPRDGVPPETRGVIDRDRQAAASDARCAPGTQADAAVSA